MPVILFGCAQNIQANQAESTISKQTQPEKTDSIESSLPSQGIVNDYPLNAEEMTELLQDSELSSFGWKLTPSPKGEVEKTIVHPRTRSITDILFAENDKKQTCILSLRDNATIEEQALQDKSLGRSLILSFWHQDPKTPVEQMFEFSKKEDTLFWKLAGEIIKDEKKSKS